MYLGIDLGTSGVKAVLVDARGNLLDQASAPLAMSTPHPRWSEQAPSDWWAATTDAVSQLRMGHDLSQVLALGLCGQMHGAVVLDKSDRILRPAILWNDGRSQEECIMLEAAEPRCQTITGNRAMPGFTAPKLLWVSRHEPEIFAQTVRVLLPKDWLRLHLTGEAISEMSDAAGTLWLDLQARRWSSAMLAATGLDERAMPRLVEGSAAAGRLRPEIAAVLGLPNGCLVAGGASDNAAGAVGIGCVLPGRSFLSLGSSGVIFTTDAAPRTDPSRMVHSFCHCLPGLWHRMSVILSATTSLTWAARATGAVNEAALIAEVAAAPVRVGDRLVFLPYLAGERTPHNDSSAAGVLFGVASHHGRADIGRAVLEGVAFALRDGLDALEASGEPIAAMDVIGGGSRSRFWLRILASAFDRPLRTIAGGEVGPALGAARLAILARDGGDPATVCPPPRVTDVITPEPSLIDDLRTRRELFRRLYPALCRLFADSLVGMGA